ncbi:MAG TPA: hypothetical protein VNU95_00450 [Candidatus Acidoferrales bacterium]|jgi:hypothetical protein|nr:hypothetical protein [Candidatus Acidoferrales bacterium]
MKKLLTLTLLAFVVVFFSPAANARGIHTVAHGKHHKHQKHHHHPRHHHHTKA